MNRPTLYGHPLSLFTRKARLLLLHKGIDHEFLILPPHADDAAFCSASPLGKIPAFRDERAGFSDSTVIAHYVERYYTDGPSLLPDAPADYARALWFEEYADTVMMPVIGGHLFAEVVLAERLFQRQPIQSDIDKAINDELPGLYRFLEEQLGERSWLAGDQVSLGDLAVGGLIIALRHCGQQIPDSAPRLRAYADRFLALPAAKTVIAEETAALASMGYNSPLATPGGA